MKLVDRIKTDTISAKNEYIVRVCKNKATGEKTDVRALYDGDILIMFAKRRGAGDFIANAIDNECFEFCETFTTRNGGRYIYWRDNELDEDYLTRITDAVLGL